VGVARQQNLLAWIKGGHHHALIAARRSVDQEERLLGSETLRRQRLRFDQRPLGLQQVVEAPNLGQVDRQNVVADEIAEGAVHAQALFMARGVERDDACVNVVEQHLEVGRAGLVELIARHHHRFTDDHNGRDYNT